MQKRALLFLVVLLLNSLPLYADSVNLPTIELAHRDAPRRQQWELLSVTVASPASGSTISLQDARGGLVVTRPVSSGVTDPETRDIHLLIPLPYLAESELALDQWPIRCTLTPPGASPITGEITVRRPAPAADRSSFRIFKPASATSLQPPQQLSLLPTIVTIIPDQEIFSGPLLLFASADVILLSGDLANKLSEERAAALLAAGVQLVIAESSVRPVPEASPLARLPWTRVPASSFAGWIAPATPLPRPQVLEPYLADALPLNPQVRPSPTITRNLLLIPLACMVVLILARGLFRHPATILLAAGAVFVGLSAIFIAHAKSVSAPAPAVVTWKSAALDTANHRSPVLTETFTAQRPLFTHHARASQDQATILYPVFASSRQYFAIGSAQLSLLEPAPNRLEPATNLSASLNSRTLLVYAARSTSLEPAISAQTVASSNGSWFAQGYLYGDENLQQDGTILTQVAVDRPTLAAPLLTWFNLRRASPDHRYFVLDRDSPPIFLDLGPMPATATSLDIDH